MPYVEFKALVKKVNLKPKGEKEIVLIVNDNGLDGKLDSLSEMIDCKVEAALDLAVINYRVTLNAQTNQPLTTYKVDDKGVVSEVKQEHQQLTADSDLELPPDKVQTKEEEQEIEREIVDEFIKADLAPSFDDIKYDVATLIKRRLEGESYSNLASELEISSGQIVGIMDGYRKRIAPLAQKWWEWKENNEKSVEDQEEPADEVEETEVEQLESKLPEDSDNNETEAE